MKIMIMLMSILVVTGCTKGLTKKGGQVQISLEAPSKSCKQIDLVHYSHLKGKLVSCNFESVKNTLRNKAAKAGGNYIKMNRIDDSGVYCNSTGEVYRC